MSSTSAVSLLNTLYTDFSAGLTSSLTPLLLILSGLIILGFGIRHVKKWIGRKA